MSLVLFIEGEGLIDYRSLSLIVTGSRGSNTTWDQIRGISGVGVPEIYTQIEGLVGIWHGIRKRIPGAKVSLASFGYPFVALDWHDWDWTLWAPEMECLRRTS